MEYKQCSHGHVPIKYITFSGDCPLCFTKEEIKDLLEEIFKLKYKIKTLEGA